MTVVSLMNFLFCFVLYHCTILFSFERQKLFENDIGIEFLSVTTLLFHLRWFHHHQGDERDTSAFKIQPVLSCHAWQAQEEMYILNSSQSPEREEHITRPSFNCYESGEIVFIFIPSLVKIWQKLIRLIVLLKDVERKWNGERETNSCFLI